MSRGLKKFELRACPDCGCADPRWCGISHRPYCPDCNKWGAINNGTDLDAINAWNNPTQIEKLQNRIAELEAELDELKQYDMRFKTCEDRDCALLMKIASARDKYKDKYLGLVTTVLMEYKAEEEIKR